jgi:microcystin-dependent protein
MSCNTTQLANFVPVGSVFAYAGVNIPAGYLVCDGSVISITTYWELFRAIGFEYTALPDPTSDDFQVPDLVGTFVSGTDLITGITHIETTPTVSSSFTLSASNIPSFNCVGVPPATKPYPTLTITNAGVTLTSKSSTGALNSLQTSAQVMYQGSTQVSNQIDVTLGTWSPVYNGANTAVSGTATVSDAGVASYEMTYIIRAWSSSQSTPPPPPNPPNYTQLPPSTAINPLADNNTYGYV